MNRASRNIPKKYIVWNTAIYIRLSKEDGNDVSLSVENQRESILHYIENSGEDFQVFDIYIDDGRTGTDSDRPEFQRMLSDIEKKKINCVIVKDSSRLSRNYAEAGHYMEQLFVMKQLRFISLYLPTLDSYLRPDEVTSIATAMQNVINEDFCRQTSVKIRGTFNVKRDKGLFIGAFAPYGYLKDPKDKYHFIVDEKAAAVVQDIFKDFISGMSKMGIAKRLNMLGELNPSSYKRSLGFNYKNPNDSFNSTLWSAKTINDMLRNRMYLGDMVQGRGKVLSYKVHKKVSVPEDEWFIVPGTHEPIVDEEVFNKAQELLKREVKSVSQTGEVPLFSGFLRCNDCGMAMNRAKTGQYIYYVCRSYKEKSVCTKHTIREDKLILAVLHSIQSQLAMIDDIEALIIEIENAPETIKAVDTLNNSLKQKDREFEKVNQVRDGLYRDWKNGDITKEDYLRLRKSYDDQLINLRDSVVKLNDELKALNECLDTSQPYFQQYKKFKNITSLERSILLELVDTIYISEGGKIEIRFRFQDQLQHALDLIALQGKAKVKK